MRGLDSPVTLSKAELAVHEVQDICDGACKSIDDFFDALACAVEKFKVTLMWKAQIKEIPKKFAAALNLEEKENNAKSPVDDGSRIVKKNCSTARVHPMVEGHIIITPTIQLNKLGAENSRDESDHLVSRRPALSPIIEESSPRGGSTVDIESRSPLRRIGVNRRVASLSGVTRYQSMIGFKSKQNARFSMKEHYRVMSSRLQLLKENNAACRRAKLIDVERRNDNDDDDDYDEEERQQTERCVSSKDTEQGNGRATEGEEEDEQSRRSVAGEASESRDVNKEQQQHEENICPDAEEEELVNHPATKLDQSQVNHTVDPLEGPSWLLDNAEEESEHTLKSSSDKPVFNSRIIFKRPRYATKLLDDDGDEETGASNMSETGDIGNDATNYEIIKEQEDDGSSSESCSKDVMLESPCFSVCKSSVNGLVEESILSPRHARYSFIPPTKGLSPEEESNISETTTPKSTPRSPRLSQASRKKVLWRQSERISSSTSPWPPSRSSSSTTPGILDFSVQLNRLSRDTVSDSVSATTTPVRPSAMCYVSVERLVNQQLEKARTGGGNESSGSVPTVGSILNVSNVANRNSASDPNLGRYSNSMIKMKEKSLNCSKKWKKRCSINKSARPKRRVAQACMEKKPWLELKSKGNKKKK